MEFVGAPVVEGALGFGFIVIVMVFGCALVVPFQLCSQLDHKAATGSLTAINFILLMKTS